MLRLALVLLISSGSPIVAAPGFFPVRDFGASGDGTTLDTAALQAAIDACASAGGGTVLFDAGTYLSGTLVLTDHVTLHLMAGATLLGSTNEADYPVMVSEYRSYTDNYVVRSLIYAEKAANVTLEGRGTLDGQGAVFRERRSREEPYKRRPYMIRMIECSDVTVRDLTIVNSPMWVQHYIACDDVVIDGITVHSQVAGNNDGIDIDSCHRVRISNCDIISGDDAIVLKATSDRVCSDIVVTNCNLSTHCNAFKLGTESNGGFQNISMSNCTVYDTRLAAIALEMVDGGLLERVQINNVGIINCGAAIFLRLGNRARPYRSKGPGGSRGSFIMEPGTERPGMGSFRQVVISNINATGIGETGCSITGLPGHPVEDVTLENIRIRFSGGAAAELARREVPEKEDAYPEYKMFGQLPAYGFFTRHVRDIKFSNVELEFDEADGRPAMIFDDVQDLELLDVDAQLSPGDEPLLWFRNVRGALVHGCRPTRPVSAFLRASGSTGVTVMGNDFTNVDRVLLPVSDMERAEILLDHNR